MLVCLLAAEENRTIFCSWMLWLNAGKQFVWREKETLTKTKRCNSFRTRKFVNVWLVMYIYQSICWCRGFYFILFCFTFRQCWGGVSQFLCRLVSVFILSLSLSLSLNVINVQMSFAYDAHFFKKSQMLQLYNCYWQKRFWWFLHCVPFYSHLI